MLATAHQQGRMEREEGQVRVVLYLTWTRVRGVVWHIALPLQMMTAVEETGGRVPASELVTGVTTRQCCWWVSSHTTH